MPTHATLVGMYAPDTFERLAAFGLDTRSDNAIVLAEIEVLAGSP